MKFEYILFNFLVIAGPLALSFDKRVHFYRYWPKLFLSIILTMIVFISWDAAVTNRHWFFNESYTLPFRFLHLPPGEWLFFITIPYSAIFLWEVLASYFSNRFFSPPKYIQIFTSLFLILTGFALLLFTENEYTAIVLIVSSCVIILDLILKTNIFRKSRTYHFSALLLILMLIFNGYLTARPIVLYHKQYQLDFRIFTIPIEDFLYGFALVFLVLIIYEKLKGLKHG